MNEEEIEPISGLKVDDDPKVPVTAFEDNDLTEEEVLEEYRGHKIVCTCKIDPDWCEKHNTFA